MLAAANYSRESMAPELWQQTRDVLNTCFYTAVSVSGRDDAVMLLRHPTRDHQLPPVPLNTAVPFLKHVDSHRFNEHQSQLAELYKRLGVRAVRTADYLTNHVLPHLNELDEPYLVLQYMAEHWLQLREFSPLVNSLRGLAFIAHGTGSPICARDLYDPEHVIYRLLFEGTKVCCYFWRAHGLYLDQPERFPSEPYTSVSWRQVLRDLDMHVTPSADDVIRAAQLLAEKLAFDHSEPELVKSLQEFWSFVLQEKLLQSLPQLSSLKLVVASWDHRERVFESGEMTRVRVVVPLNSVGFELERELVSQ